MRDHLKTPREAEDEREREDRVPEFGAPECVWPNDD